MNNGNGALELNKNIDILVQLENRYRNLIENLNDGFVRVNNGLQILQINSAFANMLGYEYEELLGKNLLDFTAFPSDQIALLNGITRRKKNEKDTYDLNFRAKNGRIVPTNINPTPHIDEKGNVIGSFAVVKDLTELKKAETTLKYQAHLLSHISEGIIVTDIQGKIEYFNPAVENILGISLAESKNKNIFSIYPLDKNYYLNLYQNALNQNKSFQREIELTTPVGIKKYLRLSTAFLKNSYNRITGTVTVVSDLTELILSRQQAEHANRAKTNFLASVSHDIRTPMISIIGASDLLKMEKLSDYQKELVMTIQHSGQQLLELINDILDLSRIEAGHTLGVVKPFKLSQLISECIETVYSKIQANNLGVFIDIHPAVPPALIGDPLQIRRVILNLLTNAINFTQSGHIRLSVNLFNEVRKNENEIYVLFAVEDTGVGIPEDKLLTVFEPFQQVKQHNSTGTGLGLAICKELVEKMGGKIWANSQVGKGSKFSFYLPLQEAASTDITSPKPTIPATNYLNRSTEKKSILIVEDNEVNCKILSYMLQNLSYNTTSVNNGNQCLEILTKQHFDLILMDMQMPILDGYETTKIIRNDKNLAHIPIIALTAFAMEGDAERCISSGCDYYLSKPVSQLELYEALNKILYNSKANNNNPSPNLIDDLIPEFITTTQELIDKLHIAIENQNLELAMDITHDLKGMCGMYGFPDLSEAAAAIHEYARHQDTSNLIKAYQSLKDKFFEQFKKHSLQ